MSTFTEEQIKLLEGKLNPEHVKPITKGGRKLSYVEGWHAIAEANRIFGFDGWERETVNLQETNRDLFKSDRGQQWRVGYIAKVRITVNRTIVREGTGYGSGFAPENDVGSAIESATKEAETDATKRALMTFGNLFGLALYDKTQANVGYDEDQKPSEAYAPKQGGGYKNAVGYTNGEMNAAGKRRSIEDLTNDMQDVHTVLAFEKLKQVWSPILSQWRSSEEEIETSWRNLALDLFKAKREEIDANTERSTLEAGE